MTEAETQTEFDVVESLLVDLLEWVAPSRPYGDVMDAWRTSCPRLPVWEEANRRGFVLRAREPGRPPEVVVTTEGLHHLLTRRPQSS